MWQKLSKATWPNDGYYWLRNLQQASICIGRIERELAMFTGTSLRNRTVGDYDSWDVGWEYFTTKIEEPVVNIQGYLPFV